MRTKFIKIEIEHLERNLGDLKNFIKKFDHRYINTEFEKFARRTFTFGAEKFRVIFDE
ncbi:MAG: hypothetical protein L6V93_22495 [Clostridiales bacterium]|nr:MAG: hypothetical protein L6V93_22495 [Clostridiales bacterium]